MDLLEIYGNFKSIFSKEIISAFIGAIIGGLFTMKATTTSHRLAAEKANIADSEILYDTIRLIEVEISTAINVYMNEYGSELLDLEENESYVCVFPIGNNTFPVYDSSPACLSRLDPEISSLVVRIYMRAKGLISLIEINNKDSDKVTNLASDNYRLRFSSHEATRTPSGKIKDIYREDVNKNARILDMGSTAEAMKLVTKEIVALLEQLTSSINSLPKPKGR